MDIAKYAGGELSEIVAQYEWIPVDTDGKHFDVTIKIKICRDCGTDRYYAIPSHRIQSVGQLSPYFSMHYQDSAEEALEDCIRGFKAFMCTIEETAWHPMEDF